MALILNAAGEAQNVSRPPLHLTQTIRCRVSSDVDHLAIDLSGHRLFLCALGNNTVEVIDLQKRRTRAFD